MLRIDFLFVWICYLKLISKSIFVFDNNYNLEARLNPTVISFTDSNLFTLLQMAFQIHQKLKTRDETKYSTMDLCSILNNRCTREVRRARNKHKEFPPERVPLQVFRFMTGQGFLKLRYMKRKGNLSFRYNMNRNRTE